MLKAPSESTGILCAVPSAKVPVKRTQGSVCPWRRTLVESPGLSITVQVRRIVDVTFLTTILALATTVIPPVPAALYPFTFWELVLGLFANALLPMLVTESGIVTEVSWLYLNALFQMLVTEFGMVTEVS